MALSLSAFATVLSTYSSYSLLRAKAPSVASADSVDSVEGRGETADLDRVASGVEESARSNGEEEKEDCDDRG